jgi:hypothetical protein
MTLINLPVVKVTFGGFCCVNKITTNGHTVADNLSVASL